ncbi:U6 snRNA-associated Sm-like protein LSm3 [Cucumispora dikerogammari]|nr:U6 snRNA-associated Sm-like protein LSm3 [Cucumispora dikerogammari]
MNITTTNTNININNPFTIIRTFLNTTITITLRDHTLIKGTLLAFDEHFNVLLQLSDTINTIKEKNFSIKKPSNSNITSIPNNSIYNNSSTLIDTETLIKNNNSNNNSNNLLKTRVIRGENILFIGI